MKNFMRSMFGGSKSTLSAAPATLPPGSNRDQPNTIEDGSDNAMRRQLVQVLLRDVLRRHGIPAHWIESQMLVVASRRRGSGMSIRLILKHWDARLLNYAQAFQNALLADISRFEPRSSEWLHGIFWQFEAGASCPYTELPDKSFWKEPAKNMPVPMAAQAPAVKTPPPARQATPPATPVSPPSPASTTSSSPDTAPLTPDSDTRDDLERLFNIRDQEIGLASHAPVGYEKTQPSPL